MTREFIASMPSDLQARLDVIIRTVPKFWEHKRYLHFTNHGTSHSERVFRLLAQLAQELPESDRLNADEIFIISAATWLYEIGMQSPNLKPVLSFEYKPDKPLSSSQLQEIRTNKHLLSRNLIVDSVRDDYSGPQLNLGLVQPADKHTFIIAEVCRWICNAPLDDVPQEDVVEGVPIRIQLLVALLRLADQLYIDASRVNLEVLETVNLPEKEFARWWAYHYTQSLPITNGQIRFHYFLPSHQKEYLGHIRTLIEPSFEFDNNPTIRFLWERFRLRLMPPQKPSISRFDQAPGFQRPMGDELINILRHEIKPIPTTIDTWQGTIEKESNIPEDSNSQPEETLKLISNIQTSEVEDVGDNIAEEPPVQRGEKRIINLAKGLLFYISLVLAMFLLTTPNSTSWIKPITNWLIMFPNPIIARWLLSVDFASVAWIVLYSMFSIGAKITFSGGDIIKAETDPLSLERPYLSNLFSMPFLIILFFLVSSSVSLLIWQPACQPPAIAFKFLNDTRVYSPNQVIVSSPGNSLILTAFSANDETKSLRCQWSSDDAIILNIEQIMLCTTTVNMSDSPGEGSIIVSVIEEFCNIPTIASIRIKTNFP